MLDPNHPFLRITPHTLHFKQPAGTSRGVYLQRKIWLLELSDGTHQGIGECAPLPQLSCDYETVQEWINTPSRREQLQDDLLGILDKPYPAQNSDSSKGSFGSLSSDLPCHLYDSSSCDLQLQITEDILPLSLPSLRFAVETAVQHFRRNQLRLWDTPFSRNEKGIPINGLIWMGSYQDMYDRIREKIEAGFRCLKLKIGAIDFEEELALLRYIRTHFSAADVELRVDANGAFQPHTALKRLTQLAELQLHSIEQPIHAGQWAQMALLCQESALPIALDEELIGIHQLEEKKRLLDAIKPQFIILKPSLHGGMQGVQEWITEAEQRCIGWWFTSALESNIGLNAIAQLCALYTPSLPQGLGTGQLFTDNFPSPLYLENDSIWYKD